MNGIQVTNFHNRSTEPLYYLIYARPQSIKQARRPEFYKYIDRWIWWHIAITIIGVWHL